MKKIIAIFPFVILSILAFNSFHKDRIEKPIRWEFRFEDNTVEKFSNSEYSKVIKLDNSTLIKSKIKSVNIAFKTGEVIRVTINKVWESCEISSCNNTVIVPKDKLEKIARIHFSSFELLWNGNYDKAFDSDYFYIRVNVNENKFSKKLPYFELSFEDGKFSKALIWKRAEEKLIKNSK